MESPDDELIEELRTLLETRGDIQLAIVFGSIASGTQHRNSDIDIAVLADAPLTAAGKVALIEQIALASGRPVDLIDLRSVGEPLLGEITRGRRLLGSDEAFASLLTRHLLDKADFGPLQERLLKERRDAWLS